MPKRFAAGCLFLLLLNACSRDHSSTRDLRMPADQTADLIITNALIWTGDETHPAATALAVHGGRFVFVGDDAGATRFKGATTRIVDAGGARILPGLIDAHVHLMGGGLYLSRLNLREVRNRGEFIAAVAERARQTPAGQWILGGRWSTESWADPTPPTKEWIDPVTPNHPAYFPRMDGHSALVNSVALKLAGIDRSGPPDPPGGTIDRDAKTGEPTGYLREGAAELVSRLIPPDPPSEQDRALATAMREAHRYGITTVHTMSAWSEVPAMVRARDADRLTLRVRVFVSEDDWTAHLDEVRRFPNDDRLRVVGFKQFMDGSLGSRTALMAEPYADNPPENAGRCGLLTAVAQQDGEILRMIRAVDQAGYTPAIHAIGDQANHLLLDLYAATIKANAPRANRRLRIEHCQHLLPGDIPRFGALGVIASMQPLHKADDARYAEQAIGAERCRTSYAFRSLLDAGTRVAFGSDWPVVTINPFPGLHAAVTGTSLDGRTFVPEQNIRVEEALRCYTRGGADAAGEEGTLGQIMPGGLADFVILNEDPLRVAPSTLDAITVRETYVAGQCVWKPTTSDATSSIETSSPRPPPCP